MHATSFETDVEARSPEVAPPASTSPVSIPGPGPLSPTSLLSLQRSAGNRAATAVLARSVAAPAKKPLRPGSTGDDVRRLQLDLNQVDEVATALMVDGIFGDKTAKAVREFKAFHGLGKGSTVDAETAATLADAAAEGQNSTKIAKKVFTLGSEAYDAGKYAHAADFFGRANELADRPGLLFSKAQALRKLGGRAEEAIALYEKYLEVGGGEREADARRFLAELKGPAKTGDEAVDTAGAKSAFGKGASLYDAGDYGHAYDEFTKSSRLVDRPGITFSRAQALRKLGGRREEAIALYEEYIATNHDVRDADAEKFLAELKGPGRTGDEAADTAAAKKLFDKGAAAFNAGRYGHAYDYFTMAGEIVDRAGILFSRAQALRKLGGRTKEAQALYEQYLAAKGGERKEDAAFNLEALQKLGAAP